MTSPRPRNVHHVTYQVTEDQTGLPTVRAQCEKFLCYWDAESRDLDTLRARVRDHEEEEPADGFLSRDQAREKFLDLGGFIPPGPTPVINTTQNPILVTPIDRSDREPEKAIDEALAPHPFPNLLAEFSDPLPGLTDRVVHSLLPKGSIMKPNHPHHAPVDIPSRDKDGTPRSYVAQCDSCEWETQGEDSGKVAYLARKHKELYGDGSEPRKDPLCHRVQIEVLTPWSASASCQNFECEWEAPVSTLESIEEIVKNHHSNVHVTTVDTPPKSTGSEPAEKPSNLDRPYTVVELVEEVPAGRHPEDLEMVKYTHVLVNGSPVRVARDGFIIDYGDDEDGPRRVVTVSLELQIDELRIGRVPHGYIRRSEGSDQ